MRNISQENIQDLSQCMRLTMESGFFKFIKKKYSVWYSRIGKFDKNDLGVFDKNE